MRFPRASALVSAIALALALLMPTLQHAQDEDRSVAGGGISVPGWQGKVDSRAASQGMSVANSKFEKAPNGFQVITGPATDYWNPSNKAEGSYSVSANFREPKQTFSHAHPYGIFIAGSKLDTDQPNLVYCVAYRDGTFLVRGFSDGKVVNYAQRQPNDAVHKTSDINAEITQEVGWNVTGDGAECLINGKSVVQFSKSDLVGAGKLDSLNGVVGLRFTHNTDVYVTGFKVNSK